MNVRSDNEHGDDPISDSHKEALYVTVDDERERQGVLSVQQIRIDATIRLMRYKGCTSEKNPDVN